MAPLLLLFSWALALASPVAPFVPPEAVVSESPPAPAFEVFEGDPIALKQFVLPNGLTVMLSENHERPTVFAAVVVRTGSKNDPVDHTGMAHYLEHMLFKGTTRLGTTDWARERPLMDELERLYERLRGARTPTERASIQSAIAATVQKTYPFVVPNELDRLLSELGATEVNAFTTEDETVYYESFAASAIEPWIELCAHRFDDAVFRLFPSELEAVYEEKNVSMDRFEVSVYETFLARAFPGHGYGRPILGTVEHLKKPSLTAMRAYFDRYYVASNMAVVLVGDFDAETVARSIERAFGRWPTRPPPSGSNPGTVAAFEGREQFTVRLTPVRAGAIGFRTVPASHPDHAALTVIRQLLTNEQGSGFIDRLVDDNRLLLVLPYELDYADHALDVYFFVPRVLTQSFRGAERALLEQFDRIKRGQFEDAQLLAVRNNLAAQQQLEFEDNEGRGLAVARAFAYRLAWSAVLEQRERVRALTRNDVVAAARRYFGSNMLVMRSRMGRPEKRRMDKPEYPAVDVRRGVQSEFARAIRGRVPAKPELRMIDVDREIERASVQTGVEVARNANVHNDIDTLELRFGVGTEVIPELELAQEYLPLIGTEHRSAEALRATLFQLATTMSFAASSDRFTVTLEGPTHGLERALQLLGELMAEPKRDRRRLRQLRRERRGYQRVRRKDPAYVARAAFQFALYGQKSPFLRDYGSLGALSLSSDELLDSWKRVQGYAAEVRYVGRRSAENVAQRIRSTLPLGADRKPQTPYVVYPRQVPAEQTVFFVPHRGALQSHVYFLVDGAPVEPALRSAADAYDAHMGGSMAGLVFQEVREFRALAYSTSARFVRDPLPTQPGFFYAYAGCQADKTFEAIDVMLGLIAAPPEPHDIAALRGALMLAQQTDTPGFRDLQDQLELWRRLGYPSDPRKALLEAYGELEVADLKRMHSVHIAGRPRSIVVVADPRGIDIDRLRRYGRLIRLRRKDIFAR